MMRRVLTNGGILIALLFIFSGIGLGQLSPIFINEETERVESNPQNILMPQESMTIEELEVRNMDIREVLNLLAQKSGLQIVTSPNVHGKVTIYLKNILSLDALRIILESNNFAYSDTAPSWVLNRTEEMKGSSGGDPHQKGTVYVMTAQEFQDEFGIPFTEKIKTKIVTLEHSKPSDVLDILNQMKSPSGKVMSDEFSKTLILLDVPEKLESMSSFLKEWDMPAETKIFELKYVSAEKLLDSIKEVLTKKIGKLEFDKTLNTITVTDKPFKTKEIESLIKKLDREDREVLFEVRILQLILNQEHIDGIDWEAILSDFQSVHFPIPSDSQQNIKQVHGQEKPVSLGTISEEDYSVLLEALDTVGDIYIISNQKVITANNKECEIVEDILKFYLKPSLGKDNILAVNIKSDLDSQDIVVNLEPGETIVLGSVFKSVEVEAQRKIPLLGDLPLVGFAFRSEGLRRQKAEVIVFFTPKIIVKSSES